MIFAYMEQAGEPAASEWVNYSDLIIHRDPDFVFLQPGDLLLTMESNGEPLPETSWSLKALYRVRKFDETGDAFDFHLDLVTRLDSASSGSGEPTVVHRREMLAALNWFPSPSRTFKALPADARRWLQEAKQVPWPDA